MTYQDEVKFVDMNQLSWSTATSVSNLLGPFNVPAQGADFNQRIGRMIVVKNFQLSVEVAPNLFTIPDSTAASGPQVLRFDVVLIKDTNGVSPTVTNLFDSTDPLSKINLNFRGYFKILATKTFNLPAVKNITASFLGTASPNIQNWNLFLKKRIKSYFQGTTSGVGSSQKNAIFIVVRSSPQAWSVSDRASFRYSARCRYIDA